jgi:hypothetical protein
MIVQQQISETLVLTYSDKGVKVHGGYPEADYNEVVDPISMHREYTETDIPVDADEPTVAEKAEAYDILMGVIK